MATAIPKSVGDHFRSGGGIVEAIRLYRDAVGCDLSTAKQIVEAYRDSGVWRTAEPAPTPTPDSDTTLQKQDLLLKMLNMTTSDNDGVALVAIRKCNTLLQSSGWTWEKLLTGKITIVEDPFKSTSAFDSILRRAAEAKPTPPAPVPPEPITPITPRASPFGSAAAAAARNASPPTPKAMGLTEISTRTNNYANPCYFCGDHVDSQAGYIFRPSDFNGTAPNKWSTTCVPCNTSPSIVNCPIPRQAALRTGKTAGLRNTKVNLDSL